MSETDDLDDLDDFLDDFQDELLEDSLKQEQQQQQASESSTATATATPKTGEVDVEQEIQKQFEQLLKDMSINDPQTSKDLEDVIKELKSESGGEPKNNFQSAISETMSRLKTSGEQVDEQIKQEQPDELLEQLLGSLGGAGGDLSGLLNGSGEDISKLLVEMLDQLSSKSVLYEPIRELYDKYPGWLEQHKDDKEYENYAKQYDICSLIISKFDSPAYDETSAQDKEYIATKLEEMQELGMPPSELMNEDLSMLPGFGGSGQELPDLPKELDDTCQQQ